MGIHEDARQGKLVGDTVTRYSRDVPGILNQLDPSTGRSPLASAAIAGHADSVEQLLKRGAKPDALSRDGENTLLLTVRDGIRNRSRIVQLLLTQMPNDAIDATTSANDNKTPLMYAVLRSDLQTIRLLATAGASLTATDSEGRTAKDIAPNKLVQLALNPKLEKEARAVQTANVGSILNTVLAWVNKTSDGIVDLLFELNPTLDEEIDEVYRTHRS
jgi:hypothetical protein